MLLRFRAANVLSFRDELELSLLAPRGVEHAHEVGVRAEGRELSALPLVAIFGANASGKSNVLLAMRWMLHAVTESVTEWVSEPGVPRPAFALDPAARDEASLFEVDVAINGVRYVYGFEVSDARVETEWLHAYPSRHKQVWFERDAEREQPYRFPSDWLTGNRRELVALTRPNALFLTVAAQFNHPQLAPVHQWFTNNLWLVTPHDGQARRHAYTRGRLANPSFRARLEDLLRAADLGIVGLDVTDDSGQPRVRLVHRGSGGDVPLDFGYESLGTHAWFAFLGPVIAALDAGAVVLADELDSSLHPMLVAEALRLFRDRDANPHGAQLICTVHDVTLLGSAHAERPLSHKEVWVTEKQPTGESELYPLTDARPRAEESLERGYLRGRYGGVPSLATNGLALELVRAAEASG